MDGEGASSSAVEVPKTLYAIICDNAPAVEHDEIKRVLGKDLVEENEVSNLFVAQLLLWWPGPSSRSTP